MVFVLVNFQPTPQTFPPQQHPTGPLPPLHQQGTPTVYLLVIWASDLYGFGFYLEWSNSWTRVILVSQPKAFFYQQQLSGLLG